MVVLDLRAKKRAAQQANRNPLPSGSTNPLWNPPRGFPPRLMPLVEATVKWPDREPPRRAVLWMFPKDHPWLRTLPEGCFLSAV